MSISVTLLGLQDHEDEIGVDAILRIRSGCLW